MKQSRLMYSNLGLFFNSYSHIIRSLWIGLFGFVTVMICLNELYLAVYEPFSTNAYVAFCLVGLLFYLNSLSFTYNSALILIAIISGIGFVVSLFLLQQTLSNIQLYTKSSVALMLYCATTCLISVIHKLNYKPLIH